MLNPADNPKMPHFFDLLPGEFDELVKGWGWPRFRAQQVREWVYGRFMAEPGKMTNLSKGDRAMLAERVTFAGGKVKRNQLSEDGTRKLLVGWEGQKKDEEGRMKDEGEHVAGIGEDSEKEAASSLTVLGAEPGGPQAECVMIPDGERRTACVSSQVGCPVGCTFCASGIGGMKGNLSAGQIVEQIFWLNSFLEEKLEVRSEKREGEPSDSARSSHKSSRISASRNSQLTTRNSRGERINHVVFMGMGEPLANYANLMKAVRILHDPECFNIGGRKITISTVGVPPKMRDLAKEELPINLAISLHAPNEALRKELIPWAHHFSLDEILDAARFYFDKTGREITLEYILLAGVNDRPEHARQLAKVCKTLRANVNLIRYNEVEGLPFKRPLSRDVVEFQEILRKAAVNVHVRKSRGRDIDAACGQLRRKEALSA